MENVSQLLGKPVISIYNGNLEGFVKNVLIDKKLKKLLWLEIFDDESQEEKLVSLKNICYLNNDAIMLKNNENIFLMNTLETNCINPIGYKVYELNGKFDDKIIDFVYDKSLNIETVILQNNKQLKIDEILNVGFGIVIKKDNSNVKLYNFKPKTKIITNDDIKEQKVEALERKITMVKQHPNKILTAGYEFLIGRKVGQNIYSENKQLLVKKNTKISNQVIDIASQNGKLKELTTYSVI